MQRAKGFPQEKLIILTGFGPFAAHEEVNASWEAVRLLPDYIDYNGIRFKLEKRQVSVLFKEVDKAVEEIWERNPELVIHCGVDGHADCIHVEKLAYNHRFRCADYAGKRLDNGSVFLKSCTEGNDDEIHCGLNVDRIVDNVADTCGCTPGISRAAFAGVVKASENVGEYISGYIYLKSLDINRNRTLFLHVPPIDQPLSSPQTSEVILQIVKECVHQLVEDMKVEYY